MTADGANGQWPSRLLRSRRAQMALTAALAAALSWVVAQALTGALNGRSLDHYVYYAPLGAVVATHPSFASSLRSARHSVVALMIGAALGLSVHQTLPPNALTLAVVVGAGVALGALPGIGEQRSWIPIVALFVLVIGDDHAFTYAAAYVGLTAIGALCGVLTSSLAAPATRWAGPGRA